jgi:hypothetical protein
MAGILLLSHFRILKPLPQFSSKIPGIARRSLDGSNSGEQLLFDPCIVSRIRGYFCVCLVESFVLVPSICRPDRRFVVNGEFVPSSGISSSPVSHPPLVCKVFLIYLTPPPPRSPSLFSLFHLLPQWRRPLPILPPHAAPWRRRSACAAPVPRAHARPDSGRPAAFLLAQPLPPPIPCHGERRGGGRNERVILRIGPWSVLKLYAERCFNVKSRYLLRFKSDLLHSSRVRFVLKLSTC